MYAQNLVVVLGLYFIIVWRLLVANIFQEYFVSVSGVSDFELYLFVGTPVDQLSQGVKVPLLATFVGPGEPVVGAKVVATESAFSGSVPAATSRPWPPACTRRSIPTTSATGSHRRPTSASISPTMACRSCNHLADTRFTSMPQGCCRTFRRSNIRAPRRVVSLNGSWQIAAGSPDQQPAHFDRAFGDAHQLGDVALAQVGVSGDRYQHVGVIGQERP